MDAPENLPESQPKPSGVLQTFLRFPFAILSAVTGTAAAFKLTGAASTAAANPHFLGKVILFSWLGLILFFVLQLFAERYRLTALQKSVLKGAGLVALMGTFLLLPEKPESQHYIRLGLIGLGLHLVSSYAPFFNRRAEHKFWQFNERLFLRILTAALYTLVLFAGIALAILAADQLFGLRLNERIYAFLWLFMVGIFNTWFFLAGVPSDYEALESERHYPRGLKVFTQYVLLPLVAVYLVILYGYLFKIMLQGAWPQGWVSNLVLVFSVIGILSLLLVHPIRNQAGNTWIGAFTKWFYLAIIPLLVLFSLAIWRRVSEYGITEMRYFVLLLAFWLFLVTVYFLASRDKNIKFIPVTLSILVFLSALGPFNAFAVAEFSQVKRLENLLVRNGMLVNGKLRPPLKPLNTKDRIGITSVFSYLNQKHSLAKVRPWVPDTVKLLRTPFGDQGSRNDFDLQAIYHFLELDKPWATETLPAPVIPVPEVPLKARPYFEFRLRDNGLARTTGYDYHTTFQFEPSTDSPRVFDLDGDTLTVGRVREENSSKSRLLFWLNATDSVTLPMKPMVQRLLDKNVTEPTEADLSRTVFLKNLQIKVVFDQVSGSVSKGLAYPHDYRIRLLIKLSPVSGSGPVD